MGGEGGDKKLIEGEENTSNLERFHGGGGGGGGGGNGPARMVRNFCWLVSLLLCSSETPPIAPAADTLTNFLP